MNSINFRVNYTNTTDLQKDEPRFTEVNFHDLTEETVEKLKEIDPMLLLQKSKKFQEELLRRLMLNGHHNIEHKNWEKGIFSSKKNEHPLFKCHVVIQSIVFDDKYEERLIHERKWFNEFFEKKESK